MAWFIWISGSQASHSGLSHSSVANYLKVGRLVLGTVSARRLDNSSIKFCQRARSGCYLLFEVVVGDSVTAGAWATIEICILSFQVSPSRTTIDVQ
jgi:hypothetical protein